ncbi:hypothetical protein PVAND_006906 [Polypedilum vanderplanki]|uniref:Peptidase S1 domain-containing protein n=1 Tax=Polypedilum vanderplanki TaxID=319348 RepID=A0A9J6C4L7_POLVA|nr:hypothetical protein PVAND_006906 [Polypedilum vanderplanki]
MNIQRVLVFILISIFICEIFANDNCGVSKIPQGLIYGGTSVKIQEWPWLVPLFYIKNDEYFCSSNLISRQHLLTVAHCIHEKQMLRATTKDEIYAYIGRFDLTKTVNEPHSFKENIKKILIHKNWNPAVPNYDSDIAILTLNNRVQFNDFVQPVCLPDKNFQIDVRRGSVVGFGKSENLLRHEPRPKKIEISSLTNDDCFFTDYNFARFGSRTTFCAGEEGKSPCKGDSGSAFLIHENNWRIAGMVSSALDQDCAHNKFVLFTNVAKFTDWIENEISSTENSNSFDSIFNEFDEEQEQPLNENVNLVDVDCKFENVGTSYGCSVNGLEAPDNEIKLVINNGKHKTSRTNRDVAVMHMKYGKISHFPDMTKVVETFANLQGFGVTLNKMKYIKRDEVKSLGKLKFFLISDNEFEVIPADTFADLKELELIDICRNKIKTIEPNWLSSMPKLRVFKARSNLFTEIPRDLFVNNPELEEILFDFNPIEKSYVNFTELKKLKNLAMLKLSCVNLHYCKDENNKNCIRSLLQFSHIVDGYCGSYSE